MILGRVALCVLALGWLGCASAKIQETETTLAANAVQQKPDRVLVYDFAVTAEDVHLNRSVLAAAKRSAEDEWDTGKELKIGRLSAAALAHTLVTELEKKGIAAARWHGPPPSPGNVLLLEGSFLDINEGNRLSRTVIGFGVGGTDLQTQVRASYARNGAIDFLSEFKTNAKSSKKPGLATPAGVGAVSGMWMGVAVMGAATAVSEALGPLEGNIKDTSKQIAKYLADHFVERGWLTANEAP